MARTTTKTIGKWATWIIAIVFVISLGVWFLGRDTLPRTIRIATAEEDGLYHKLGLALKSPIEERIHRDVVIESTEGSVDNMRKLRSREVDLAVVQGGSVPLDDVSVVTPLFPELVLIIVRKGSGIEKIADLAKQNVSLGSEGSGNRVSALRVLKHFEIDVAGLGQNDRYFGHLLDEPTLDAAIVTAGIGHADLVEVFSTNQFELLPIADAEAVDMLHPYLRSTEVPRGLFAEHPPVPAEKTPTIATTAYLVARNDAPDSLVSAALAAVHEESLRLEIPTLIPRQEASSRVPTRFHPVAQRYFNPSDNIGYITKVMESMVATKELLFAIGAGIYLLWLRWRGLKRKEAQEAISHQKERLDVMLEETLCIEEIQMRTNDVEELRALLDEVTRIKLRALQEFTEEELRGDQAFTILQTQCANLINKLQLKIISLEASSR
ncbi:MAG: TAXI family TRAP transporter solute-binding subunit [Planctomycetes bacterium]|nr:TAXI family TRAP transporter solute-binding subunit [Planctomycetota bacterium]MBL7043314.1 TAXI family TRAP transporter solute-binding subunit [Pirellulaceae bacterium]